MKKVLIATALTLMCSAAFAQNTTGPAPQSDNMSKGSMDKGMKNDGTTGMNNNTGMAKDNMKKDMSKEGSPSGMKQDMKK